MKKIITTLVAGAMMFGFTAPTFAAINPANIDESSSRDNIYKIVWEDVSEGTNAGVVSIFAWAHIDGTIYSVALADLRKHGDPSKAFAELVGAQLAVDQAANLVDALETRVSDNNGRISTVITTIDAAGLADAQAEIAQLSADNERLEDLIGNYDPLGQGWTHEEFLNEFIGYYQNYVLMHDEPELPEETFRGLTGSLVDIVDRLYIETSELRMELAAIEAELNSIKTQIDLAGEVNAELGFASSVDWDSATTLEKAELIAEKLPTLVAEFSLNAAELETARLAVTELTGYETRLGNVQISTAIDEFQDAEQYLDDIIAAGDYGILATDTLRQVIVKMDQELMRLNGLVTSISNDLETAKASKLFMRDLDPVRTGAHGSSAMFTWTGTDGVRVGHSISLEFERAIEEALDAAYNEGFEDGYRAGWNDGYDAGFYDGENS